MPTPSLTIFENQKVQIGRAERDLSDAESERLMQIGERRPGLCERGYGWVRISGHSGILSLGERTLEILPKIGDDEDPARSRKCLLRMLRTVRAFRLLRHLRVPQGLEKQSLLDVFIAAFLESVADIVRGGLMRRYEPLTDDLVVVRGRIQAGRQFAANANRPDRIACAFDELEVDNPWNRLVKAGLRAVRPWIVSEAVRRKWRELMIVFDEVANVEPTREAWRQAGEDRHAIRYRECLQWVRWILATLSPDMRSGHNDAPGLLFNMSMLFQATVGSVLERLPLTQRLRISQQDVEHHLGRTVLGEKVFPLRPDIVLRDKWRAVAIADAKWKIVDVGKQGHALPSSTDLYQMYAYAAAYGCADLLLIYPSEGDPQATKESAFTLPRTGNIQPKLRVVFLDLQADPFRLITGSRSPMFDLVEHLHPNQRLEGSVGKATFIH
jgi:5-methylcytosine-specific restriction enzyme subunit McrC